jgi:hypothetical protein
VPRWAPGDLAGSFWLNKSRYLGDQFTPLDEF